MARKCDRESREMEISAMKASSSATLHCVVVGSVSPVKTSRKNADCKFFEAGISDGKKVARMISFEPKLHGEIETMRKSGESVKISNCTVQESRLSGVKELEVVLNSRTNLLKSPKKFNISESIVDTSLSAGAIDIASLVEVDNCSVNERINITGKITILKEPEKVYVKSRDEEVAKQSFIVADSSGSCRGVVWGLDIGSLQVSNSYKLINVNVCLFNGKYISVSAKSVITEVEDIGNVMECCDANDVDVVELYSNIIGIIRIESYNSCSVCKSKVTEISVIMGECIKCGLKVRMSKCKRNTVATLLLEDEEGKEMRATAFQEIIDKILKDKDNNLDLEESLLDTPCMKFTIKSDIICTVEV